MSSIKIRIKHEEGKIQIKILISHPMEHGRNKDPKTNQLIPAHFIQELTVQHNDKLLVNSNLGAGISKDPYFSFILKGGEIGDKIIVSWRDNLGNNDTEQHVLD